MSNRRLLEKAQKLQIQKENPSLWTGLRKPGQPSKIFNRAEAEAEYQSNVQAEQELTRRRTAELEGGTPAGQPPSAPAGQPPSAPTGQPQPSGAPTGQPSGAVGSNVGFSKLPEMRETFAEADARTRREKTLSGAFGEQAQKRAENLEGRKGLFAEMKASSQKSGGDIPMEDMTRFGEQAKKLGIADENFEKTVFRVKSGKFAAPTASAPSAPLTGRALAESNIKTMGVQGAAADYFRRRDTEMQAKQQKVIDKAMSTPFTYRSGEQRSAPASTTPSFSSMFSREVDNDAAPMPVTPTASLKPLVQTDGDIERAAPPPNKNESPYAPKYTKDGKKLLTDAQFVDLGAPFVESSSAFKKSFAEEEAKGFKTPLRSATIATVRGAGAGLKTMIGELRGKR